MEGKKLKSERERKEEKEFRREGKTEKTVRKKRRKRVKDKRKDGEKCQTGSEPKNRDCFRSCRASLGVDSHLLNPM